MESEQEKMPKELSKDNSDEKVQVPTSITWMQQKYTQFQQLTRKNVADNIWLIALKWILKGIMVLVLIIMSPFIIFMIVFSLLIAG